MIRTPLNGTVTGVALDVVTIFIGNDNCFGSVVFNNIGAGAVDLLKDSSTTTLATIAAGGKLAMAAESIIKLELSFVADSTVTYKGCICCNSTEGCVLASE